MDGASRGVGPADVFDTAAVRAAVLAAWAASPARFREDANAEEDLVRGGYRDRLVVELAQNAADAASRAQVAGRLLLRLEAGRLVAASTGAPLDTAGVGALSTLRASSKREGYAAGRFGVGFASVLAVTDEPVIGSRRSGGVRWSRVEVVALVGLLARAHPALATEAAARGSAVPVLRLPFPAEVPVPEGYDTAVELPLRDEAATELVRVLLRDVAPPLLLALPALSEIVVELAGERRVLTASPVEGGVELGEGAAATRWTVVRHSARADPAMLADRPLEERNRVRLEVTWALPDLVAGPVDLPGVVLAPTPTDEPLGLPAVLVATLPLEPTRRRTAPGPLRDAVLALAGESYAELVAVAVAREPGRLAELLPGPLGLGEVDAAIRAAAARVLPATAIVPGAVGAGLLAPASAVVVEDAPPEFLRHLAEVVDGVAAATAVGVVGLLERLGTRRMALVDAVDALAGRRFAPERWAAIYTTLEQAPLDALGALPVPLADGRTVRGARGAVLAADASEAELAALEVLGVRVVHPAAVHRLLERLGAATATPAALLGGPEVAAAVAASAAMADEDALAVSTAVLTLAAADPASAARVVPRGLLLPDGEGELAPADELCLPGAFADLVEADAFGRVAEGFRGRWGDAVLRAVGVLDGFGLVVLPDVVLDADDLDDLEVDGVPEWAEDVAAPAPDGLPARAPELALVRDLSAVAPERWPEALALLARPPLRAAVLADVRVVAGDGTTTSVLSPAAWWLRRHVRLGGTSLPAFRLGGDPVLDVLFAPLPVTLDPEFARALGVRGTLAEVAADPRGVRDVLDRLADPALMLGRAELRAVYELLAAAGTELADADLPARVRVLAGPQDTRVADAADALVLDSPDLLPLLAGADLVVVSRASAVAVADLLQIGLASEELRVPAPPGGVERPVPTVVRARWAGVPATWFEHEQITVDAVDLPSRVDAVDLASRVDAVDLASRVDAVDLVWLVDAGRVHASTVDGLARGLAWLADAWPARGLIAELLQDPGPADLVRLLAEHDLA